MIWITRNLTSQMRRLANFIVLEGGTKVLLVRPYTNDICAHWRFVDEPTVANLIRYTKCSLDLSPNRTSLVWTWRGNSWRWVLQEHVAMLIIPVEGSTIKCLVKSDPKSTIGEQIQKQRVLLFLRKYGDVFAYDAEYVKMRKEWRTSE